MNYLKMISKKSCIWVLFISVCIISNIELNAQSEQIYSSLVNSFTTPNFAKWGEVPLWWWEADSLNKERVTWELEKLREKGVKAVCPIQRSPARSFPNSFSKEWWEMVSYVHQECERLGMHLWLYIACKGSGNLSQRGTITSADSLREIRYCSKRRFSQGISQAITRTCM